MLSPPPVLPQSLRLHTPCKQHIQQKISDGVTSHLAGVKLDSTARPTSFQIPLVHKSHSPAPSQVSWDHFLVSLYSSSHIQDFPVLHSKTLEIPDAKGDSLRLPPILPERKASSLKVIIQNGHLMDGTRDFSLFKKEQHKQWKQ